MWWQLARTRWERKRYLRRVLREARRDVLFGPPAGWSPAVAIAGFLVALTPLAFVLAGPRGLLAVIGGVLVSAQAVADERLTAMSPRLVRMTKRLMGAAHTVAAIGLAFSPAGEAVRAAWHGHPVLWRHGGLGLLALLAGLSVLERTVLVGIGLGRLLASRVLKWVRAGRAVAGRIVVGHGEFAVVLVAVAHADDDLVPAAVTLAAVQTARLGWRLLTRSTLRERLADALGIAQLQAEMRQRELAGWLYDTMIVRTGRAGLDLPRTLIRLARLLAPDVTRDADTRTLPSHRGFDVAQSRAMLGMAGDALGLLERAALPRIAGVRRRELDQRVDLLRADMAEIEARLALADDEPEEAVAHLGEWARRLAAANLPNLAANARTLQSCVALQAAIWLREPIDGLADIVDDESLSWLVRRSALRLLAADRATPWSGQEPDLRTARAMWRLSRYLSITRDDYRVVALETRIEAGARRPVRIRRYVRGRLYERRLAIVATDLMTRALVLGAKR